jgi:hypothetical protein
LTFDVGNFFGSALIAYAIWVAAAIWAGYVYWPGIKRWRPFTLAPEDGEAPLAATRNEEWMKLPLTPVTDATFRDQPVPLDGYAYDRCTFIRCTFVYKGEKPFSLRNFKIEDDWNVKGASAQLQYFTALLTGLRFLGKDIEVDEEFKPDGPVAYGQVQRSTGLDDPSKTQEQ